VVAESNWFAALCSVHWISFHEERVPAKFLASNSLLRGMMLTWGSVALRRQGDVAVLYPGFEALCVDLFHDVVGSLAEQNPQRRLRQVNQIQQGRTHTGGVTELPGVRELRLPDSQADIDRIGISHCS
jgi:hypothetical protein